MTIKTKLVIAASVFLLISITFMVIGFYVVKDMSDGLTFINYAGQTRYKTYRLAWLMEEHSEGKKGIEPAIRKEMYEFERLLFSLRDGNKEYAIKGAQDGEILSRLNKHIKDWAEISALIEKELKTSVNKDWIARYHVVLENYVLELDATVTISESKGKAKGKTSISEIYFLAAFSLFIFFAFLFYIYREMTVPLRNLINGIRSFSKGDLKARINIASNDEMGEAASSFNNMANELEMLYNKLNSTVAQLTKANYKLERTNRLRGNIVTIVSHELKTPLTSIKGFVHTLMREGAKFDEAVKRKYLSIINSETDRLSKLINDMMDMTRIEMGRMELKKELVSISRVIRDAAAMLNISDIEFDLKEDISYIWLDKNRIEEVILNLMDNAVKYSPKGGRIRIRAYEEKDFIKITVDDEGHGIQENEREKVFDAFYRAPSGLSYNSKGLGLGLYICKGIIEAHKGEIWIEEKQGKGTMVAFTLPKGE
ncbi:MAG: HAMP domain-containing protein [Deltaproteobacteria bacterium]|nr:HAMP domain-containing protein [Deltaproteobacteria bacterium]